MASYQGQRSQIMARPTPPLQQIDTSSRRQSSASSTSPNLTSPRVQLVPHARTSSYDGSLSPADIELLANTNFDAKDMSSRDFDFEDVFTYDKPQRKLKSIIEVSAPSRDWSNNPFPPQLSTTSIRQRYSRTKSTAGEMYMKNQDDARKR